MNRKYALLLFFTLFLLAAAPPDSGAIDFWQYPEMAESNSLFISCFLAQFTVADYFAFRSPEVTIDYLLPFGIPLFLGLSIQVFDPEFSRYDLRLGYHVNFDDENLDVYFFYKTSVIFSDKYVWLKLGGRIGFRRRFGPVFCVTVETGFMLQDVSFGVSVKLN
jgi:hypothetical protein